MPKSAKHKAERKADFQKRKLKLGKGGAPAANFTNTSFRTGSVGLPVQTIGGFAHGFGPSTKRGQTLETLLIQLNHYSPKTRRDAIIGVQELLTAHPIWTADHVGNILKSCTRLVTDDDATVRRTLIDFYNRFLPIVPRDRLTPFLPLLLLSTTSALTHIFPEVRIDGIKVLDNLLHVCPSAVTAGWSLPSASHHGPHGKRVLDAYLSILQVKGGQHSALSTPEARLVALRSFSEFLRTALREDVGKSRTGHDNALPCWIFASSCDSPQDYTAFLASVAPENPAPLLPFGKDRHLARFFTFASADDLSLSSGDVSYAPLESRASTESDTRSLSPVVSLLTTLRSMLISTFLEAAPIAFTPSTVSVMLHTEISACAVAIAVILWRRIATDVSEVSSATKQSLKSLLDKMGMYFPFSGDDLTLKRDAERFKELDLMYCELMSLYILLDRTEALVFPFDDVETYILNMLERDDGVQLSAQTFTSMTPTLFALLRQATSNSRIYAAIVRHFAHDGSASGAKRQCLMFLSYVIELARRCRHLHLSTDSTKAFYTALPRMLWDLQARDPATSTWILSTLHRAALRGEIKTDTLEQLRPFFSIEHKVRGPIKGPYGQLPSQAKMLAKGLVFYSECDALRDAFVRVAGNAE